MFEIGHFGVDFGVGVWNHEIAKDDRLGGDHVGVVQIEIALNLVAQELIEPAAVLVVDETVLEDAATLVVPQFEQLLNRLQHKSQSFQK